MQTILIFIAVLGVVVLVHELGHFTVAKLARVQVLEFGLGLPPRLFGFKWGETTYSLNLLPLGGFVKMMGEEDPTHPRSLARRSPWVRLAVLAAGPAMNALLPVVLITIVFMVPRDVPVTDVVITAVAPGSPAASGGLQIGDVIREVDGRIIDNSDDLRTAVQVRLGARSEWVVQRGDTPLITHVVPRFDPPKGEGAVGVGIADARITVTHVATASTASVAGLRPGDLLLGVGSRLVLTDDAPSLAVAAARTTDPAAAVPISVLRGGAVVALELSADAPDLTGMTLSVRPEERRSEPIWEAVPSSLGLMRDILIIGKNEVSQWISGAAPAGLVGPIGIAQLTGEVARSGLVALVFWTALLSMSLAILNFLPIPALDGGRIAFVLLELARGGRRIPPEKEGMIHMVGFFLLMGMILVVSFNDIQRILSGESFISG